MSKLAMPVSAYEPLALELKLPWVSEEERERKLKRQILIACAIVLMFIGAAQLLPIFPVQYESVEQAKTVLLLEPTIVEEEELAPEPEPIEPPKIVRKPAKTTGGARQAKVPAKKPEPNLIQSQGLDQLSSQLSSLSAAVDLQKLRKKNVTNSTTGEKASTQVSRLGADQITQRSGGVIIDDKIMRTNATQLASRETTVVDGLDLNSGNVSATSEYGDLRQGTRDMESIRQALEAAKSRIYAEYQRALAENQDLAGKFRFQLVIEPDGSISSLSLLYSELGIERLEQKILSQIKNVNFGNQDVITTQVEYTYVFLPG